MNIIYTFQKNVKWKLSPDLPFCPFKSELSVNKSDGMLGISVKRTSHKSVLQLIWHLTFITTLLICMRTCVYVQVVITNRPPAIYLIIFFIYTDVCVSMTLCSDTPKQHMYNRNKTFQIDICMSLEICMSCIFVIRMTSHWNVYPTHSRIKKWEKRVSPKHLKCTMKLKNIKV